MSNGSTKRTSSLGTVGFMVAAVVFAALAGLLLSQVLESRYSTEPVQAVVVAKTSLQSGVPLRGEDLSLVDWPQSSIPEGAFTSVKGALEAKGVPLVALVRGEPVLQSHLSKPDTGLGVAGKIEKGKRAMSIRTDDPVALARLVYPGARVDVLATVQSYDRRRGTGLKTSTVLQNVKVLAVGEDIDPMTVVRRRQRLKADDGDSEGAFSTSQADSREARGVITLLVGPHEAERLARAARRGKIDIALRNPQDSAVTASKVATVEATNKVQVAEAKEAEWGLKVRRSARKRRKRRRRRASPVLASSATESGSGRVRIYRGGK